MLIFGVYKEILRCIKCAIDNLIGTKFQLHLILSTYYPEHLHYFKLLKLKYVITNFVIVQIMCTAIQNWIIILLLFVNSREYDYTISKTHTQIYIYIVNKYSQQ